MVNTWSDVTGVNVDHEREMVFQSNSTDRKFSPNHDCWIDDQNENPDRHFERLVINRMQDAYQQQYFKGS